MLRHTAYGREPLRCGLAVKRTLLGREDGDGTVKYLGAVCRRLQMLLERLRRAKRAAVRRAQGAPVALFVRRTGYETVFDRVGSQKG